MPSSSSRREFLRKAATAASTLAAPALLHAKPKSANARIRFAVVGVGGMGGSNLRNAANFGDIVALCDVDANTLAEAYKAHPNAATYSDYRRMLDRVHNQIDAVVVSTPDHCHAVVAAAAIRLGKHVYCEKPMARTIYEVRRLAELAREMKVQTQMGNQGTADTILRKTAAFIRSGALGKVKELHVWTDRAQGMWPQGVNRPASAQKPANVDWDLWLGPAPDRPYAPGYHPFAWRGWWDFGTGSLGDMGCHCMNMPFQAFDLRAPVAITAETSGHNKDSFPAWAIVTYEFPATSLHPAFKMYWYDGGKKPSQDLAPGVELDGNGSLTVCEKGTVYSPGAYGQQAMVIGSDMKVDAEVEESPGHWAEFARAIETGKAAKSNFPDYAGPMTEMVLAGNMAMWASGSRIEWDATAMRAKNNTEVNALVRPTYRSGYSL